jgi:hypothetical protein
MNQKTNPVDGLHSEGDTNISANRKTWSRAHIGDETRLWLEKDEPSPSSDSTRSRRATELMAWRKLMASASVSSMSVGPRGSSIMAAATSSEAISG